MLYCITLYETTPSVPLHQRAHSNRYCCRSLCIYPSLVGTPHKDTHVTLGFWSMSRASPSIAVVFHGRIQAWQAGYVDGKHGSYTGRAASKAVDVSPDSTLIGMLTLLSGSFSQHVMHPAKMAGLQVDVFIHSWHPRLQATFERLYHPRAHQHDELRIDLRPVASQHLSMRRALDLASKSAVQHDLFFVSRHDVYFYAELPLRHMVAQPKSMPRVRLWLPHLCLAKPLFVNSLEGRAAMKTCAGHDGGYAHGASSKHHLWARAWSIGPPLGSEMVRPALRPALRANASEDLSAIVQDWWFAGTAEVAAAFALIAELHREYLRRLRVRLGVDVNDWSHFHWAHVIRDELQLRTEEVRFALHVREDFNLLRKVVSEHDAEAGGPWCRINPAKDSFQHEPSAAAASTMSLFERQCPVGSPGWAILCPWHAPACGGEVQRRTLANEARIRAVMNATTLIPAPMYRGAAVRHVRQKLGLSRSHPATSLTARLARSSLR